MSNNRLTNLAVIDTNSGEITQYLTQDEQVYLENKYTSANPSGDNKLNDDICRKNSDLFYMFIEEMCGSFYHNYYNNVVQHKYIFRFLYICTFMNFKNYIEFGNAKEENKLATKKDIQEILKLKDQQFYETYNYLIDNELILEDEGYIKINSDFCNKGKLIKNNGVVRMFNNAIQYLYEQSNTKEHNKIGMLIKLLPYVHFDTNILCSNPTEENEKLIKPLKQNEILEILDITKPTVSSLLSLTILDNKEFAFIKFSNGAFKNVYVINPRFMYKGNSLKANEVLKWFQLGL
jgi:hypothetical protein